MSELPFQEDIAREVERRRRAHRILRVRDGASIEELRRAWRQGCLRTHPDRNPENQARKEFQMINCAYHFLVDGVSGDELLAEPENPEGSLQDGDYNLENSWGLFLWWRDRFF